MRNTLSRITKRAGLLALLAGALAFSSYEVNASDKQYSTFNKRDELSDILKHSKRIGLEPELLMAVRMTENGSDRLAYGIIPEGAIREKYNTDRGYFQNGKFHPYKDEKEKQMCWAGWTLKKRETEYNLLPMNEKKKYSDFFDYLARRYAPHGVKNDPNGLNNNWLGNFTRVYRELKKSD